MTIRPLPDLSAIGDDARYVQMPSGLVLPVGVAHREIAKARRPSGIDLFAGAGGMSLGMIQAGWEVVAAVEWDPIAAMTYMTNLCRYGQVTVHPISPEDVERTERVFAREFKAAGVSIKDGKLKVDGKLSKRGVPTAGAGWIRNQPASQPGVSHIFIGDARKLTGERLLAVLGIQRGELDGVFGGPPCQGYSTSGKRDVMDPRNSLVFEFARLVCELHPKTMVMEEVPAILTMVTPEGVPVVDQLCRILEDGGFGAIDAFKKSIGAQTGNVGLLRGKAKERSTKKKRAANGGAVEPQADLFGATA